MNTIRSASLRRVAGSALPVVLFALLVLVLASHNATRDHEGAFEGPCRYHAVSSSGPVAELTLTDYGAPVQVGYLIVEERNSAGSIINAHRVKIVAAVSHQETRTFTVPAIAGAATCRLVDWGE